MGESAPRPLGDDGEAWRAHWVEQGQPWRRQPEISPERQVFLAELRARTPSIHTASYDERRLVPFAGVTLSRADIEWLLATHEDQGIVGLVEWEEESHQQRVGPDIRGADLRGADLSDLPLVRLIAGPDRVVMQSKDEVYVVEAEVQMDSADLHGAKLDGASLRAAHLKRADLAGASLRSAMLPRADLAGANLSNAILDETNLAMANLDGASLQSAHGEKLGGFEMSCQGADARQLRLHNAEATFSDWMDTDLTEASLNECDLSYASLRAVNLTRGQLQHANLANTDLERADLRGADLRYADLNGAYLSGAQVEGTNVFGSTNAEFIRWEPRHSIVNSEQGSSTGLQLAVQELPLADAEAPIWQAYWQSMGQPWRREALISPERRAYLTACRGILPNLVEGVYPFKHVEPKLSRADIEWLLAAHESEGKTGPLDSSRASFINWGNVTNPVKAYTGSIGLDLRGADLRGLDLSGLPLSGLRGGLSYSETLDNGIPADKKQTIEEAASLQLHGANLRDAVIDFAILMRAGGDGCDLSGAGLQRGHLEFATLDRALLTRANLAGAIFDNASLVNSHLEEARCQDAKFSSARFDGAQARGADFSKAVLGGVVLRDVCLEGASLRGALLDQITVEGCSLVGAQLDDARMRGAQLVGAQLEGASMRRANLQCYAEWNRRVPASLNGANLRNVNLQEALLERTDCRGVDLSGADLTHSHFKAVQLSGGTLDRACLAEAELFGVSFDGASLKGTDLRRAICDAGTTFEGVRFGFGAGAEPLVTGVRWNDADLGGVDWSALRRLGDEGQAWSAITLGGERKPSSVRLVEFEEAISANRQLARALAEQGLEEADRFAYRAQTLQRQLWLRQTLWRGDVRSLGAYLTSALLAVLTGYGYRMVRLLITYVLVVSLAAAMYMVLGASLGQPLTWPDAFLVSVTAFHGRVFFAGFSPSSPLSWIAAIEGVMGVVIEGVFVAMLIQRFFSK